MYLYYTNLVLILRIKIIVNWNIIWNKVLFDFHYSRIICDLISIFGLNFIQIHTLSAIRHICPAADELMVL